MHWSCFNATWNFLEDFFGIIIFFLILLTLYVESKSADRTIFMKDSAFSSVCLKDFFTLGLRQLSSILYFFGWFKISSITFVPMIGFDISSSVIKNGTFIIASLFQSSIRSGSRIHPVKGNFVPFAAFSSKSFASSSSSVSRTSSLSLFSLTHLDDIREVWAPVSYNAVVLTSPNVISTSLCRPINFTILFLSFGPSFVSNIPPPIFSVLLFSVNRVLIALHTILWSLHFFF